MPSWSGSATAGPSSVRAASDWPSMSTRRADRVVDLVQRVAENVAFVRRRGRGGERAQLGDQVRARRVVLERLDERVELGLARPRCGSGRRRGCSQTGHERRPPRRRGRRWCGGLRRGSARLSAAGRPEPASAPPPPRRTGTAPARRSALVAAIVTAWAPPGRLTLVQLARGFKADPDGHNRAHPRWLRTPGPPARSARSRCSQRQAVPTI